MTPSTRWRVAPLVGRLPDRTCETVLIDTFAALATSRMVTAPGRASWSTSDKVTGLPLTALRTRGPDRPAARRDPQPCVPGGLRGRRHRFSGRRAPGPTDSAPRWRGHRPVPPGPLRPRNWLAQP